jgi:hypothetical protein
MTRKPSGQNSGKKRKVSQGIKEINEDSGILRISEFQNFRISDSQIVGLMESGIRSQDENLT